MNPTTTWNWDEGKLHCWGRFTFDVPSTLRCSQLVLLRCFHRRCGLCVAWEPWPSATGRRTHGEMFAILLWRNWSGRGWKGPWLWQVSKLLGQAPTWGGWVSGVAIIFPSNGWRCGGCLEFCFEPSESTETTGTPCARTPTTNIGDIWAGQISLFTLTQRRAKRWPMLIHHFTTYFQCFVLPLNSCSFCKPHARWYYRKKAAKMSKRVFPATKQETSRDLQQNLENEHVYRWNNIFFQERYQLLAESADFLRLKSLGMVQVAQDPRCPLEGVHLALAETEKAKIGEDCREDFGCSLRIFFPVFCLKCWKKHKRSSGSSGWGFNMWLMKKKRFTCRLRRGNTYELDSGVPSNTTNVSVSVEVFICRHTSLLVKKDSVSTSKRCILGRWRLIRSHGHHGFACQWFSITFEEIYSFFPFFFQQIRKIDPKPPFFFSKKNVGRESRMPWPKRCGKRWRTSSRWLVCWWSRQTL